MEKNRAYLAVILIQSIYAGMFLLSKAVFNGGMNTFVFIFYRQAAATVFLMPLTILEWKQAPPLSFKTFCKIFMLSLCGITLSLDLSGIALVYTSATLASATTNCLPVITFFLALLFRMETLKLKTTAGIAKLIGVIVCLSGAATLAFFKGPQLKILHNQHIFGHAISQEHQLHVSTGTTWVKGCFIMLMSNTCFGLWLVLQAFVMKSYPSKLLFTTLQCFTSSIQTFVVAVVLVRDPSQWKLGWNIRLLAVAYCGILVTGITYYLQAWVIEKRGPVFLAMSTPLAFIITILSSAFLLGEIITLGSVVGGLLLVLGLYGVLWGKNTELKINDRTNNLPIEVDKEALEFKEIGTIKSPQLFTLP